MNANYNYVNKIIITLKKYYKMSPYKKYLQCEKLSEGCMYVVCGKS